MYSRILRYPLSLQSSFFLFGPRGTGKTTWLRTNCPLSPFINLLDSTFYSDLLARPARLGNLIPPNCREWIIIDEIQRIPELLNEVHRLIEEKKYRFIMTGSSARSLRRGGVNLLAGRAYTFYLYPLTTVELTDDFSINRSFEFGHLPSIYSEEKDPKLYLDSYVQTYLREEVLQEGVTRNLGGFSRFLEAASFSQASVLNITDVARECGLERRTVSNYFQIVEDLLIAVRVPVFTKRAKRRLISHSKFYFIDAGIFRTIRPTGPLDRPEEIAGAALETLCFQELCAVIDYYRLEYSLFFWRTSSGSEVDFVLYGPRGIVAIEVKHTDKIFPRDLKHLNLFKSDYPEAKRYLFYMGNHREYYDDIEVIPVAEALTRLSDLL